MFLRFLEVPLIHLHSLEIHFFLCLIQLVADPVTLLYVFADEELDLWCCGKQVTRRI